MRATRNPVTVPGESGEADVRLAVRSLSWVCGAPLGQIFGLGIAYVADCKRPSGDRLG
jgi:hypothetical protein